MSSNKKYYWLKLQKDFFKRHDIRIVESMENGKDYIIFYLKLLAESISHNGNLRFSETIPYSEKMLATITDTNIDIVRSAVKIFTELDLMDLFNDGTYFMTECQKMMGSETEWAKKKAEYRERKRIENIESGQKKDIVRQEIEKELDLEKELDKEQEKEKKKTISKDIVKEKDNIPYDLIIEYLNTNSGKNFKSSSKKTREFIKTRWNDGFRYEDFKIVITKKCAKWYGTNMQDYLRPETLFSNKFESYLNESDIVPSNTQQIKYTSRKMSIQEKAEHELNEYRKRNGLL